MPLAGSFEDTGDSFYFLTVRVSSAGTCIKLISQTRRRPHEVDGSGQQAASRKPQRRRKSQPSHNSPSLTLRASPPIHVASDAHTLTRRCSDVALVRMSIVDAWPHPRVEHHCTSIFEGPCASHVPPALTPLRTRRCVELSAIKYIDAEIAIVFNVHSLRTPMADAPQMCR